MKQALSDTLFAKARKLIPGGVNSPVRAFRSVNGSPFFTRSARGAILTTVDGQELIDFVGTWGPAIHGHNHPAIRKAIADALENGTSFGTPCPYEVEIAELITEFFPSIQKVRMCNSGTEATMSAVRLARGYTGRNKIIKFSGCYHGHSDSLLIKAGSGALTHGHPDSAGIPESFSKETLVLPFNDTGALEAAFANNKDKIAGVIIEPFCGNMGFIKPDQGYLTFLREITEKNGTVLIFDEVMTGFRVSAGGVQEVEHIVPDITTLGKIIGGGLPVGAIGGKAEIMDMFAPDGPVYQAGTLSGNPLAMAAGIASLKLLKEQPPYEQFQKQYGVISSALLEAAKRKGIPLQVPGYGGMFSLFFTGTPVRDYQTALTGNRDLYKKFFQGCLDGGVFLAPSAYETAFLSTAHTDTIIEKACDIMSRSIAAL